MKDASFKPVGCEFYSGSYSTYEVTHTLRSNVYRGISRLPVS